MTIHFNGWKTVFAAVVSLIFFCPTSNGSDKGVVFKNYGAFTLGAKSVMPGKGKIAIDFGSGETANLIQTFTFDQKSWKTTKSYRKWTFRIEKERKNASCTGFVECDGEKLEYNMTTRLAKDGLVKIKTTLEVAENKRNLGSVRLSWPIEWNSNGNILLGNEPLPAVNNKNGDSWDTIARLPKGNSVITFFPKDPERTVKIILETCAGARVAANKGQYHLLISPLHQKNIDTVELAVNLGSVNPKTVRREIVPGKKYWGVDFYSFGKLQVPFYEKCRNMIQNPSFEAGLRYYAWDLGKMPITAKYEDIYSIDPTSAKFGEKSLRMKVFKELKSYTAFATAPVPLKRGANYTVSFYAKTNQPGLSLTIFARGVEKGSIPIWPKSFKLGAAWKRYTASMRATLSGAALNFTPMRGNKRDGLIWIDGVQLEEGGEITPFTQKPVIAKLRTSNPDNFIEYGQALSAKLDIHGGPGTTGKTTVKLMDFQKKTLFTDTFSFKIPESGVFTQSLPLEKNLTRGVFVLKADITLADGFQDTDFFRFAVMNFMKGEHKHKNLFCNNLRNYTGLRYRDMVKRLKQIGVGAYGASGARYIVSKFGVEAMNRENVLYTVKPITMNSQGPKLKVLSEDGMGYTDVLDLAILKKDPKAMTPEFLKKIEGVCRENAKKMSWIKEWNPFNEPSLKFPNLSSDQRAKLASHMIKGLRAASPDIRIGMPPPCVMRHFRQQEEFLMDCQKYGVKWDIADIHVYRYSPESPDLDSDTRAYLEMLDRVGLPEIPVYYNEGMWYSPYMIPAWGVNVYFKGMYNYYLRSPSYDMGWGEKLAAAFDVRSWLICLKYADRVKVAESFNNIHFTFMDYNLTPFAVQKAINTLARLLGDADFKKEIRFAPFVRSYVFEDEKQRPVVAMWSHIPEVDKGLKPSPVAILPFGDLDLECFDMMEAPIEPKRGVGGNWELTVTPFPMYIRGRKGDMEKISQALEKGSLKGSDLAPVVVDGFPVSRDRTAVRITNLLTRNFSGSIAIQEENPHDINVKPAASTLVQIKQDPPASFDKMIDVALSVSIKENAPNAENIKEKISYRLLAAKKLKAPITIDGDLKDWNEIPAIPINQTFVRKHGKKTSDSKERQDDLKVAMRIAWDQDNLYLAISILDKEFVSEQRVAKSGFLKSFIATYDNDAIQLFFDTLGDARTDRVVENYGPDDYQYHLFVNPEKRQAEAYRYQAADPQMSGLESHTPEPDVKTAFRKIKDGYLWEAAFPARYLRPLELKKGKSFGLGVQVNDHDGQRWNYSRVNTPNGEGCYMNPKLYPLILLSE